jgi:hypothetical protein
LLRRTRAARRVVGDDSHHDVDRWRFAVSVPMPTSVQLSLVVCGIPAAMQQQRHSPILMNAKNIRRLKRVYIVAAILVTAITTNVVVNDVHRHCRSLSIHWRAVWVTIFAGRRPPSRLGSIARGFKGSVFLLSLRQSRQ